ncbi:MAG: UDP-N-acetylmuramoyl-L-alanyl-D-glutamate--2,6-diaminopimelate ligase [Peptostreptococcaceae bacterium]
MKLQEIIKDIEIIDIKGKLDIDVSSIEFDSRKIVEGTLFVCVRGFSVDGHKFIKNAIEKGAKSFLVEEDFLTIEKEVGIDIEDFSFMKVKNTRKTMAKIATNFYRNPSKEMDVVGVTGTNGKTSITTFLNEILSYNDKKVGLVGTIKIFDGIDEIESSNTTPESIDLQNYFRKMVDNNCESAVMEVSSHSLVLDRVFETDFKIGVFTNLTPDHLDFHKDLDDYRDAKEKLFLNTSVANIINIDDEGGKVIYANIKNLDTKAYTYSVDNKADFYAKNIEMKVDGVYYTAVTPTYETEVFVPVCGKFTIYNTLAVIATCYLLNIDKEIIVNILAKTSGVNGRFEKVENNKGMNVVVDYAHTPDALENVINTSKEFTKGKVITVFGCGGDRDTTKRPMMAKISTELSDFTIITSDNPRTESPNDIINDIVSGVVTENYKVVIDRKDAIIEAIKLATPKDLVLIAGKGHETYQIIGKEKTHFDDKEVAREFICTL